MASTPQEEVFADYGIRIQRLRNWFRLILAAALALALVVGTPSSSWALLLSIVGVYALFAVAGLAWWYFDPPDTLFVPVAATWGVVDVVVLFTLLELTNGSYLLLLFLFVLPVFSAFNIRQPTTAITLGVCAPAFAVATVTDPLAVRQLGAPGLALLIGAHLFLCALVFILTTMQRTQAVRISQLLEDRSALLTEVMTAEERQRQALAEELHDEALQTLLAARHDLEEFIDSGESPTLRRAEAALDGVARALRQVTSELHPAVLETAGLASAIRSLARAAEDRAGLVAECDISYGTGPHDALLFSVTRELISNVVRHADATRLWVELKEGLGQTSLTVTDDGKGFDPDTLRSKLAGGHIGVASQRVRVEAVHGRMEFLPLARGTSVSVVVPAPPRPPMPSSPGLSARRSRSG
ncbi:sensor histidine kinase [Streptomyces roseus]|uniref:sensor histidine kinase n=1 Tax=Streptomyces roseus TaxID=66430 RepID=UPI00368E1230